LGKKRGRKEKKPVESNDFTLLKGGFEKREQQGGKTQKIRRRPKHAQLELKENQETGDYLGRSSKSWKKSTKEWIRE